MRSRASPALLSIRSRRFSRALHSTRDDARHAGRPTQHVVVLVVSLALRFSNSRYAQTDFTAGTHTESIGVPDATAGRRPNSPAGTFWSITAAAKIEFSRNGGAA